MGSKMIPTLNNKNQTTLNIHGTEGIGCNFLCHTGSPWDVQKLRDERFTGIQVMSERDL